MSNIVEHELANSSILNVEKRCEAVISTGHLREETNRLLTSLVESADPSVSNATIKTPRLKFRVTGIAYGFRLVCIASEDDCDDDSPMISEISDIASVLVHELGYDAIEFDRDANTLAGFPVFDW